MGTTTADPSDGQRDSTATATTVIAASFLTTGRFKTSRPPLETPPVQTSAGQPLGPPNAFYRQGSQ